ncbi:MAG: hypothetical protein ACI9ES_000218 [Oceanospirillaceae bacterium]
MQVKVDSEIFTAVAQDEDTSNATLQALLTAVSRSSVKSIKVVA